MNQDKKTIEIDIETARALKSLVGCLTGGVINHHLTKSNHHYSYSEINTIDLRVSDFYTDMHNHPLV